jgi:hypothetical protein
LLWQISRLLTTFPLGLQVSTSSAQARSQGQRGCSTQKGAKGAAQLAATKNSAASGATIGKGYLPLQNAFGIVDSHKTQGAVASTSKASSCTDCHPSEPLDLNWADFIFNLISMSIVYMYFSKANNQRESLAAVLLCTAVAAFDIAVLLMQWLWCGLPTSNLPCIYVVGYESQFMNNSTSGTPIQIRLWLLQSGFGGRVPDFETWHV